MTPAVTSRVETRGDEPTVDAVDDGEGDDDEEEDEEEENEEGVTP